MHHPGRYSGTHEGGEEGRGVLTGMREKVEGGGKWRRTSEPAREWEVVNRLNAEGYPRQRRRDWPEPQECSQGR